MVRKNILILAHDDKAHFIDICNQYAKIFDPQNYHVTVMYLTSTQNEATQSRTHAEEIIFGNFTKRQIRGLKIFPILKLLALCKVRKFSVVICQRYKPSYVMLWVALFCKIPVCFFVMHAIGAVAGWQRKLLLACLAKKNMYFAGVSNAARDDIRKNIWRVSQEKVITLYNSIDFSLNEPQLFSRNKAREQFSLSPDDFVFGTVGRLVPGKDQGTLIKAFARLKKKYSQMKLLIVGEGPEEFALKQLSRECGIQDAVIFTGLVPLAFRYLQSLDVFILPSIEESFGRVLIEAMLAKVPVIGARSGGIPEVIGDAGMIVEVSNVEMLTAAMEQALTMQKDLFNEWRETVYERVKHHFSIERFQEDFFSLALVRQALL